MSRDLALDLLDARKANAALTAEVEQLRGVAVEKSSADAPAYFNVDEAFGWASGWNTLRDHLLALPTNAPEATDG